VAAVFAVPSASKLIRKEEEAIENVGEAPITLWEERGTIPQDQVSPDLTLESLERALEEWKKVLPEQGSGAYPAFNGVNWQAAPYLTDQNTWYLLNQQRFPIVRMTDGTPVWGTTTGQTAGFRFHGISDYRGIYGTTHTDSHAADLAFDRGSSPNTLPDEFQIPNTVTVRPRTATGVALMEQQKAYRAYSQSVNYAALAPLVFPPGNDAGDVPRET